MLWIYSLFISYAAVSKALSFSISWRFTRRDGSAAADSIFCWWFRYFPRRRQDASLGQLCWACRWSMFSICALTDTTSGVAGLHLSLDHTLVGTWTGTLQSMTPKTIYNQKIVWIWFMFWQKLHSFSGVGEVRANVNFGGTKKPRLLYQPTRQHDSCEVLISFVALNGVHKKQHSWYELNVAPTRFLDVVSLS